MSADLLGRHVRELALERAGARLLLHRVERLGDAEVDQLHLPVVAEHDVLRRHVAMHDRLLRARLVGVLVRVAEAARRLARDVRGHERRHRRRRRLVLRERTQQAQQVLALDVLHDDEELAVLLAELVDLHDVGVREARRDLRLVDEHVDELRILVVRAEDLLDDDGALEAGGAFAARTIHVRHASAAEAGSERVLTEAMRRKRRRHESHFTTRGPMFER